MCLYEEQILQKHTCNYGVLTLNCSEIAKSSVTPLEINVNLQCLCFRDSNCHLSNSFKVFTLNESIFA